VSDIVLSTLNARFSHSAFGLRYLLANLGDLRDRATILEFEASRSPVDVAAAILDLSPRIVGLGAYIWNIAPLSQVVSVLKRARPELNIILGGPEVSYETGDLEVVRSADHVIQGEADLAFREVCEGLLAGRRDIPKLIAAPLPELDRLSLPYDLYTGEDIAHRVIYVEASRGCPYTCEFCLSSLDVPMRRFPLAPFLAAMQRLLDRGARLFKFVDRTFNLDGKTAAAILDFFLERLPPGLFLHFEMIPDRLPATLRERIRRFPLGSLQFEVGIQTFNEEINARIRRRQDSEVAEANLRWLREETGAHVHADLIAGLPGESLASFAGSFDRLFACRPHEIQVGLLKRLRGTPIGRHDESWGMAYSPYAPYEVLQTAALPFKDVQRIRRFARFFDLIANSGRFPETAPLIWQGAPSPFAAFMGFSDWLHARLGRNFGIALDRLAEALFKFLTSERDLPSELVGPHLLLDWARGGRNHPPPFLRPFGGQALPSPRRHRPGVERQDRRVDVES
jgi:radical SAM superfamily enzyme YgiQ (UPF0313 family)